MTVVQLKQKNLFQLAPTVVRSPVEKEKFGAGIVHLGIGAFHRAHQAVYTQAAIAAEAGDWGILGVSLRSSHVRDLLSAQDNLYSVIHVSDKGESVQLVSVIKDVLFAGAEPDAVVDALADHRIKIVTLTITEKGYHQDPASGNLKLADPEIIHDLDLTLPARTALGFLVRGLKRRQATGGGPLTLISCDNLPENGRVLMRLLQQFCTEAAPELLPWLAEQVTCPCSMVDGIVPAATSASLQQATQLLGLNDHAAIVCEDFRQWVIEDNFAGDRPAWEAAGVELVADVRPFEKMKLRLLNGGHSALAYLGYLGGYQTIAEVMADPSYKAFALRLMCDEAGLSIRLPEGYDLAVQAQSVITRFSNPGLAHRTWQICMDGSQKLPPRLLTSLYSQMAIGRPMPCILLAVAAWMIYVGGRDEQGGPIEVSDPLAEEMMHLHMAADGDDQKLVVGFLAMDKIFGAPEELPKDLAALLTENVTALQREGARSCVKKLEIRTRDQIVNILNN
ncbi:MAG: mannitol dehydrogenase family protein [Sneathiella sp.]